YYNKLTFIFSAESFNQMLMRMKYFKHYSQARQQQAEQISKLTESLGRQKAKLNSKIKEKSSLLAQQTIETENLNLVKSQQSSLVLELTQKEKELKKELQEREKAIKKLDKLISDIIAAAAEKERKERELREAAAKKEIKKSVTEGLELSSSFAGNINKLPWPVSKGTISHKFGKQPHPVLKGVYIENLGIDIQTLQNEPVRSVFQGKVITVAQVPGMNNVVMIQHGEYFTVYAKLKSVYVKTGDEVKAKQVIGEVYTDKNNNSELQFQIWKNSDKLDPEKWLYMK
ncbi:MAG TPA: peptidoglycan DD-metalloendopeptidase family protein, partial [Cytophagaceae bacterium]